MLESIIKDFPSNKAIGLLFSASYCKWCKTLCPLLEMAYSSLKSRGIEIVLVGSDKSKEAYDTYTSEFIWPHLSFDDFRRKKLREDLQIKTIPALVFIDMNGNILERDGRRIMEQFVEQYPSSEWGMLMSQRLGISDFEYKSDHEDF